MNAIEIDVMRAMAGDLIRNEPAPKVEPFRAALMARGMGEWALDDRGVLVRVARVEPLVFR